MLFQDRQNRTASASLNVPPEARREAVRRFLSSATLEKSVRLRDLVSYLAQRSLEQPDTPIPEQEIGTEVFGRKDYSASHDNLVRVQVTQLRKKLEQYFSTEGAEDPVVFEIPRGGYALRFRFRKALPGPVRAVRRWRVVVLGILAGLGLIAAGWFARGSPDARDRQPAVRKLWSQFFGNGLETHIILADANLTFLNDFTKKSVVLREYGRTTVMKERVDKRFTDPELRKLTLRMAGKYFVTLADAVAARKIEALGLTPGSLVRYGFARGFVVERLMRDNAILLGNKRANPWVELLEPQLRFRYAFDEEKTASSFVDTQAGAGEERIYPTVWERASHCQVAVLPNLRQTGSVLVIAGGDQSAAEAGSEFLTNERWVLELARRLGVTGNQRFPYFEVFLQTETVSDTAPSFRLLFCHRVSMVPE